MASQDSSFSQEAIRKLRAHGWLTDGSMEGAKLRWANLEKGYLWGALLQKVDFHKANLSDAFLEHADLTGATNLTSEQLIKVRNLRRAKMPSGKYYDGRFNIEGDFFLARQEGVNIEDPNTMAKFYGVAVEEYIEGQVWAQKSSEMTKIL